MCVCPSKCCAALFLPSNFGASSKHFPVRREVRVSLPFCPGRRRGRASLSLFEEALSRVTFGAPFNIYPVFSDRVCASQRQQLGCCHFADALSVKSVRSCFLKMQETRQLWIHRSFERFFNTLCFRVVFRFKFFCQERNCKV